MTQAAPVFTSGVWPQPPACTGCPSTGGCPNGCARFAQQTVGSIKFYPASNRKGWICPRCDAVNSPDREQCGCRLVGGEFVT
jgi:hypothetical protein